MEILKQCSEAQLLEGLRMCKTYLTAKQVGEILSVSTDRLAYWRFLGKGPTYRKIEGLVRYHIQEVLDYLEQSRVSSTSETPKYKLERERRPS